MEWLDIIASILVVVSILIIFVSVYYTLIKKDIEKAIGLLFISYFTLMISGSYIILAK